MSSTAGSRMPMDAPMDSMSASLARNWWAVALRGVVAILFGLAALLLPGAAIGSLVLLFAAYMLADALFGIVAGLRAAARHERWGLLILEGLVNLAAGLTALLLPGLTVVLLVTLLGVWAALSGMFMTVAAFRLHASHGRWLLALAGVLSIVWGALLYLSPLAGAVVLTWWLGAYSFAFGSTLIGLAFRLRGRIAPHAAPTMP